MRTKRSAWRKLSTGVFSLLLAGAMLPNELLPHANALSGSTPIRVAVSINSSNYDNSKDYVTLTGKFGGLSIGFNTSAGFRSVYEHDSQLSIRGSLDSFYIVAGEYSAWSDAAAAGTKLKGSGLSYNIFIENRNGQKIYQVVHGYYETLSEAQAKETTIKGLGFPAKVAGWYRVNVGSYSTYQAASTQAGTIRTQGFDAYVSARQTAAGANTYEVWVGNESSSAARDSLKASLAAKGIQAADVSYSTNYILFKQDGITDGNTVIPHLVIESTTQEVAVQGKGTPAIIRFEEKNDNSGTSYRGQLILRGYNKRLALVNNVTMDEYLKGVVPREMSSGWPLEALKAQAVAARTYAARQDPNKWGIAQVDDSTWDQAYGGYTWEHDDTNQAVDETRGQVLMYDNGTPSNSSDDYMASTLFSATHGGRSADGSEVWGNAVPYLKSVDSHWDMISIQVYKEPDWHRVMFPSGMIGYVRADFVTKSGTKNNVGLEEATINTGGVNIRPLPDTSSSTGRVIGTTQQGDRVLILETRKEYDVSSWMRGYTPAEMQSRLGTSSPVTSLYISKTGPSGRPLELTANGQAIAAPYGKGDNWRPKLGVDGTLFTIEQTGQYTVLGADGKTTQYPDAAGQGLNVISGSGTVSQANGTSDSFVIMNGTSQFRVATKQPSFILWGGGWGHGLGMSQWGAYGMAAEGFKYDAILTHYYTNTYLTPKQ